MGLRYQTLKVPIAVCCSTKWILCPFSIATQRIIRELEVPLATARSPNASLPLRVSKSAGLWDVVSCTQYYTFCGVTNGAFHPFPQTVRGYLLSTVTPRFGDKYDKHPVL